MTLDEYKLAFPDEKVWRSLPTQHHCIREGMIQFTENNWLGGAFDGNYGYFRIVDEAKSPFRVVHNFSLKSEAECIQLNRLNHHATRNTHSLS